MNGSKDSNMVGHVSTMMKNQNTELSHGSAYEIIQNGLDFSKGMYKKSLKQLTEEYKCNHMAICQCLNWRLCYEQSVEMKRSMSAMSKHQMEIP